jgi:hypothetical protein
MWKVRIVYHLLILDRSLRRIYVESYGQGWMVPLVPYVGPPYQQAERLAGALRRMGIAAWPVHDALLPSIVSNLQHGYCAYVVDTANQDSHQNWFSLTDALRQVPRLNVQREALTACINRFLHPIELLDSPERAFAPETWAREALVAHQEIIIGEPRVLRHHRSRRITVWPTASGDVYLKVSNGETAHEVAVTRVMAAAAQDHFVSPIDADLGREWWLYRGAAGVVLTQDRLTPEWGERVGATLAKVQRESMRSLEAEAAFNSSRIGVGDLMAMVGLAQRLSEHLAATEPELAELSNKSTWRAISRACRQLERLPLGFLHIDLWLPNIVDCQRYVAFLDLAGACWGPVVLSLGHPLDCLRNRRLNQVAESIVSSYVQGWQGSSYRPCIETALNRLPVTGRLFRLKRQLGVEPSSYASLSKTASDRRWLVNQLKSLLRSGRLLRQ